jgi:hypothetical protein
VVVEVAGFLHVNSESQSDARGPLCLLIGRKPRLDSPFCDLNSGRVVVEAHWFGLAAAAVVVASGNVGYVAMGRAVGGAVGGPSAHAH